MTPSIFGFHFEALFCYKHGGFTCVVGSRVMFLVGFARGVFCMSLIICIFIKEKVFLLLLWC